MSEELQDKPELELVGQDGNAFFIIGRASGVLRSSGYSQEVITKFQEEASSGDYDHVIQTCMEWFDVI